MRVLFSHLKEIPYFSLSPCLGVMDGMGIYGNFLHYAIVISMVGGAFFIFLYLWGNKRLDLDEEPKFQMMREEELQEEGVKKGERECQMKQKIK